MSTPVIARITQDNKLKIKGILFTGYNGIKFDKDGNLSCLEVFTQEPAFNDTSNVDDTRQLDEAYQFDETQGIELFLAYIFGITPENVPITYFRIDNKRVLLSEILENQTL